MALFKRNVLKEKGLTDEQVEFVMTEASRALSADYMPKADLQGQIDAAVATARTEAANQVKVEDSDAYKALQAELNKTRAIGSEDFSTVKPKFREAVYGLLDHEKPVADQLPAIREQYEEYFNPSEPPKQEPGKPQFVSPDQGGGLPKGGDKNDLGALWGFAPKK